MDPVDLPADLQLLVRRARPARPARSPSWSPSSRPATRPTPDGRAWARADRRRARRGRSTTTGWRTSREAPVNWCPGLGTVLANEEVTADGRSERGNFPVFKRNLRQWMMRITAYADRLLDDLDALDWPEPIKLHAAQLDRPLRGRPRRLRRSTAATPITRLHHPAGHPVRRHLHGAGARARAGRRARRRPPGRRARTTRGPAAHATPAEAVAAYRAQAAAKTDVERQAEAKEKTGVFTGAYATNPVNGEQIPVFIADYVLMGYGTGAIMAVPGHDERDFAFAERLRPADRCVVAAAGRPRHDASTWDDAFGSYDAQIVNSASDDVSPGRPGRRRGQGARSSSGWRRTGIGDGHGHLPAARLAVQPPALLGRAVPDRLRRGRHRPRAARVDAAGGAARGRRLLAAHLRPGRRRHLPGDRRCRATSDWVDVELDLGDGAEALPPRDQHHAAVGRLLLVRAALPGPDQQPSGWSTRRTSGTGWARATGSRRGGVDLYVGGVEHAVLHLLYARFWHKVLFDLGHVSSVEPFHRLFNQGKIQAYAYSDSRGIVRAGRGGRGARRRATSTRASRSTASTARWASP